MCGYCGFSSFENRNNRRNRTQNIKMTCGIFGIIENAKCASTAILSNSDRSFDFQGERMLEWISADF